MENKCVEVVDLVGVGGVRDSKILGLEGLRARGRGFERRTSDT